MRADAPAVDIYGKAHLSIDWLGDGDRQGLNLSSNSSRIGFRASQDIHNDLTVLMQLEQNVRYDERGG